MQILFFLIAFVILICAVLFSVAFFMFNKSVCEDYNIEIGKILFSNYKFENNEQISFEEDYKVSHSKETCMG